jgi:P27 family predicted phage terminase small subunit
MVEKLAPPEWLKDENALREWDRITSMLSQSKALTPADQTTLAHACAAHGLALRAMNELADEPLVQTNEKTGMESANPLIAVAERARNQFLRYASEFGLSPRARRLGLGPNEEEETEDELGKFMNEGQG